MSKTGRPAKPLQIHKLIGSYRPDRHEDRMLPTPSVPECPEWVRPSAKKYWEPVGKMLYGLNVMAVEYTIGLALLVDALADWVKFAEMADTDEPTTVTGQGTVIQSPVVGMKNKAWDRVLKASREFGITPASVRGVQQVVDKSVGTRPLDKYKIA
jgi:P27 family predicted phage terminase small subunit